MDLLWPELGVEAAGANLRKAVHFARRAMGSDEAIRSAAGMLSLWGGNVEVDAVRFITAADPALAAGDEALCAQAADLYPGDPLPADRYEPWAAEPRARLRERYVALLKGAGRWERALELDETDEESHRALIARYYQAGRRREAIRQFERLRDALREFMGVGPDPDDRTLRARPGPGGRRASNARRACRSRAGRRGNAARVGLLLDGPLGGRVPGGVRCLTRPRRCPGVGHLRRQRVLRPSTTSPGPRVWPGRRAMPESCWPSPRGQGRRPLAGLPS